ncbi:AHH domain-containing protein [uncultured Photobacterium sp.]|uniref:AHH domain-containing protein n=1 Tax=uncultured Photobacterium sp. TaxID=173973 RepID=UPI00260BBC9A|nr:AHH domain-containing protein [uncultured Photobacterium sp.]
MSNKENRPSLNDSRKIKKHILYRELDCPITSHHLISYSLFDKISIRRTNQMNDHNYNRDSFENLVLLPSRDKAFAKHVACYYCLPWHSSGHTGRNIIKHFNENKYKRDVREKKKNPFLRNVKQMKGNTMTEEEMKTYNEDVKGLKRVSGYHKIVSTLFLSVLKKLKCNQSNLVYNDHLDELSEKICDYISYFELLLSNPGYNFASDQVGCREVMCNNRKHDSDGVEWVLKEQVDLELKISGRLKLLSEI